MNNKQQKLVSVIIPAYNIEKYISQTIESVICQTYKNIEIIIVNDGSTDNTDKIIQEYGKKDERIVIYNQLNKGLSAARNSGFKIAKGDYFCLIDGDDIMLPEKIESQIYFLEKNIFADFIYSKVYCFIDGTNNIYIQKMDNASSPYVYNKLLSYGNFISPNSVFFKRNIFDKLGGFDENLRSSEDFDYWLYLSKNEVNFLHQDKYLTLCRSRKDSLTSNSIRMYTTVISVFEKNIGDRFLSKITHIQYLKNKFLLLFSILKKPKISYSGDSKGKTNLLSISYYANFLFTLLRRIKFLLTFRVVKDKKIKDYLISIESHKIYGKIY